MKFKPMRNALHKILFALLFWASTLQFAYAAITIEADKPSGTYDAPFSVTLTASDPAAKIWYVFNPDAPPGDALAYKGPIRIEKTTPLLYFAYTDPKNESKIERKDYKILPPTTLRFTENFIKIPFEATTVSVTIENFGTANVPLENWTIRTDKETRTLTAANLPAGSKKEISSISYSEGAIMLSSPDSEIRSTVSTERLEKTAGAVAKIPTKSGQKTVATVFVPNKPVTETPSVTTDTQRPALPMPTTEDRLPPLDSRNNEGKTPLPAAERVLPMPVEPEALPSPIQPIEKPAIEKPMNTGLNAVKTSASESAGNGRSGSVVLIALLLLALGTGFRLWSLYLKNRK